MEVGVLMRMKTGQTIRCDLIRSLDIKYYIYQLTHTSGKVYIGRTNNLKVRTLTHLMGGEFDYVVRNNRMENWTLSILKTITVKHTRSQREISDKISPIEMEFIKCAVEKYGRTMVLNRMVWGTDVRNNPIKKMQNKNSKQFKARNK